MNIIEEIKQDSSGLLFLKDWLGEGGQTVTQEKAEERAKVCLGCPKNTNPNWWSRWLRNPIANAIRNQLEIKNRLRLRVEDEDNLHMCACCGCCLKLKVFVPDEHVVSHTPKSALDKMPSFCWIKQLCSDV